jgi:hypothetical protein
MEVIIIIGITIFITLIYLNNLSEEERRQNYSEWAQLRGWSCNFEEDYQTYNNYYFLSQVPFGASRYVIDVVRGRWNNYPLEAFNFHYQSRSTHTTGKYSQSTTYTDHYIGVVIIELERDFPKLLIYPKGFFCRIAFELGFKDIEFGSLEFTRVFTVSSDDQKFASSFCNPQMIEYLLNHVDTNFEINDNLAILYKTEDRLDPSDIEEYLRQLYKMRQLMPKYLFNEES